MTYVPLDSKRWCHSVIPLIWLRQLAHRPAVVACFSLAVILLPVSIMPATDAKGLGLAVLSIGAFAALLWFGAPVLLAAPILAFATAIALHPSMPIAVFETQFAGAAGSFVGQYFAIFVLGAIFGRLLVSTGCAQAMARPVIATGSRPIALSSVAALSAAMTLGGVGVFVIAFAVFPIARRICAQARLPVSLAPAAIAFGAFTVTMTALPGAPSLTNIIAGSALGTSAYAAPWPGLVAASVMGAFGIWWLWQASVNAPLIEYAAPSEEDAPAASLRFSAGLLPLVITVVSNAALTAIAPTYFPAALMSGWGNGYWCVAFSLIIGTVTALLVGCREDVSVVVRDAASAAVLPLAGTAVCVGFGAVLASGGATVIVFDKFANILGAGSAAFSAIVAGLCALVTGSSSAGLALALDLQASRILAEGSITAADLHRFASLGAGTLDTLPHSAAVISLLAICGTTHAAAYRGIFITTVIGPILGLILSLLV